MGGTIFQKEGVKVKITPSKVKATAGTKITPSKVKATAGTKEINQKMTFKVKMKTQK
jgi:hypothetical protein